MDALQQAIGQFPMADNIQQALDFIQPYDIWRLQSREAHGENNIPQWHLLREICRRWDAGMPTPGPDIRTEAVRIAFPRGWPNNQLLPAPPTHSQQIRCHSQAVRQQIPARTAATLPRTLAAADPRAGPRGRLSSQLQAARTGPRPAGLGPQPA